MSASERHHRASRSGRCIAAAGLIATATVMTAFALVTGTAAAPAAALDVVLAAASTALIYDVVVEVRRVAGQDRADNAARAATDARERAEEHIAFVVTLGRAFDRERKRTAQLSARTRELEARLSDAESELTRLRDQLWMSESAEKRARAALVIAEQEAPGRHLRPA